MIASAAAKPHRRYYLIKIIAVSLPTLMLALLAILDDNSQTQINSISNRAQNCIGGIQMVSDHEGWAGSCSFNYNGILHFQNGQLAWESTPGLESVSMNAQDGWGAQANGSSFGYGRHLFHYQHGQWIDAHKELGENIADIKAIAPNAVWALTTGGRLWHYDGYTWQQEELPTLEQYSAGMTFVSATEGWAWDAKTLFDYSQGHWGAFPYPSGIMITDVISAGNDVWLLSFQNVPYHYNFIDKQWMPVIPLLAGTPIIKFTFDSLSLSDGVNGWLTGYTSHSLPNDERIIDHYFSWQLVDGQFMAVNPPKEIDRIEMTGLGEGWGVGFDGMPSQDPARFLAHYDHGSWHMTVIPRLPLSLWVVMTRIVLALLLVGLVYFAFWLMFQAIVDSQLSSGRWQIVMGCSCAIIITLLLITNMLEPFIFPVFQPNLISILRAVVAVMTIIAFVPLLGTAFARKPATEITA